MPILNETQLPLVAARVKLPDCASLTADAAADVLNAPSVPNPVPQGTVPRPFHLADVLACLTTSLANVEAVPYLPSVIADFEAANLDGCLKWIGLFDQTGKITPAEAGALAALVQATEPDPDWVPLLSWWQATFGDAAFIEQRPAEEYDPIKKEVVPVMKDVTCTGHCTPLMVAEARGGA